MAQSITDDSLYCLIRSYVDLAYSYDMVLSHFNSESRLNGLRSQDIQARILQTAFFSYLRYVADFFRKEKKYDSDMNYKDYIDTEISFDFDKDLNNFINKVILHSGINPVEVAKKYQNGEGDCIECFESLWDCLFLFLENITEAQSAKAYKFLNEVFSQMSFKTNYFENLKENIAIKINPDG